MSAADAIIKLADVLAASAEIPNTRIGKVVSVDTSGSVWMVNIEVEGSSATRRCRWLGSGSQPRAGELVTYINESPIPTVLGRVSNDTQDQSFGTGQITAGAYVDGSGNLRTGISGAASAAASAASAASVAHSVGSAAQSAAASAAGAASAAASAASNAQNTANNAAGAASAAQSAANNALNTANTVNGRVTTLQGQVNNIQGQVNNLANFAVSLERSLIEAYNQINFLNSRINQVEAYAVSLEATLISYLGPGGPDD